MLADSQLKSLLARARRLELDAGVSYPKDMGSGWEEELGVPLKKAYFLSQGFADATLAFMQDTVGGYHVGIGECLRPYESLYEGSDEASAYLAFSIVAEKWIHDARESREEEGW